VASRGTRRTTTPKIDVTPLLHRAIDHLREQHAADGHCAHQHAGAEQATQQQGFVFEFHGGSPSSEETKRSRWIWQTPCQCPHALKSAPSCGFPLIIEREHSSADTSRGHRTQRTTPQHAAILDRSSGALLCDEVNQTLATGNLMMVGVLLRLKEYPNLTAFVAQLAVSAGKPATG